MDDYKIIVEQEHQTVVGHYDVVISHFFPAKIPNLRQIYYFCTQELISFVIIAWIIICLTP